MMKRKMRRRDLLNAAPLVAAAMATSAGSSAEAAESGGKLAAGTIREPAREIPVVHECDLCVVGGSCTGVFAAVAAARLGAKVALIESNGFFGGVATASLVSIWHSLIDLTREKQIIAGLTTEVIDRLRRRDAIAGRYALNTEMLKLELDDMVSKAGIRAFLHAQFVTPIVAGGRITAAVIEDKSGRRAIRAKQFIDATGDADVVARMGLEVYARKAVQPPTMCCVLRGLRDIRKKHPGFNVCKAIFDKKYSHALRKGFAWVAGVPGAKDHIMLAGTRVFGANCADADELTRAEMEGRRQVRAICDLLRENFMGGKGVPLAWLPAKIGIRETRHARCVHTLKESELLSGKRFPDAIGNGTYPVDIHSASGAGVTFRRLKDAPFYQIPFASLVPRGARNVLVAGRGIDADEGAFGAVRVMVNCNQMGHAAGVAAWHALDAGKDVDKLDIAKVRAVLKKQGAVVI
jgi:hypothetical protein